jgi:predicted DNA binding CopG/RHH family protein
MKEKKDKISTIGLPATLVVRIKFHCCKKGMLIKAWTVKVLETALNKEDK